MIISAVIKDARGIMQSGCSHHAAFEARNLAMGTPTYQGFLNDNGQVLSRENAAIEANQCKQVHTIEPVNYLQSYHLAFDDVDLELAHKFVLAKNYSMLKRYIFNFSEPKDIEKAIADYKLIKNTLDENVKKRFLQMADKKTLGAYFEKFDKAVAETLGIDLTAEKIEKDNYADGASFAMATKTDRNGAEICLDYVSADQNTRVKHYKWHEKTGRNQDVMIIENKTDKENEIKKMFDVDYAVSDDIDYKNNYGYKIPDKIYHEPTGEELQILDIAVEKSIQGLQKKGVENEKTNF